MISWLCLQGESIWQVVIKNPLFFFLLSLRRRRGKTFPMSHLWFGYQEEELLETAHGDSHRFEEPSVPPLSFPLCTQGQSQVTHEGKGNLYWQSKYSNHQSKNWLYSKAVSFAFARTKFPYLYYKWCLYLSKEAIKRKKELLFHCLPFHFMPCGNCLGLCQLSAAQAVCDWFSSRPGTTRSRDVGWDVTPCNPVSVTPRMPVNNPACQCLTLSGQTLAGPALAGVTPLLSTDRPAVLISFLL